MQIEPQTALFLAHRSGATTFTVADLGTPQVNIAYGSYYLRFLLDHYGQNKFEALAAYNGGEANVDRWAAAATVRRPPVRACATSRSPRPAPTCRRCSAPSATTGARIPPSSGTASAAAHDHGRLQYVRRRRRTPDAERSAIAARPRGASCLGRAPRR